MIPELSPSTTSSSASTTSTIQHNLNGGGSNGVGVGSYGKAAFVINGMMKPYELTDYFKYNSKFKQRGLNSSSNSLISLNSSRFGFFLLFFERVLLSCE
jgi:hypothetical protein